VEVSIEKPAVGAIVRQFQIPGECVSAVPFGNGHINDTYRVVCLAKGREHRAILQRINTRIFQNPEALMANIERVTSHLAAQVAHLPDAHRRVTRLIPTCDGQGWLRDPEGGCWRAYSFIEGAASHDNVTCPAQAFQAARAFGQFQGHLATLPAPRLFDTIPDFHHTPKRFAALEAAIQADGSNRAHGVRAEIEFALARKSIAGRLLNAGLPERVTHNDTKLNNVLIDEASGEGLCVVDLDTVMPGLALYDFGDMVRTSTSPAAEDEPDLRKVQMLFPLFEALVRGYLETAGGFLTRGEKAQLAFSGQLITFEIGIRFLTDYLNGDTYFKIHHPGHNLDRCRTQFTLVERIEEQEEAMNRLVESLG
jgi:hypothetical protein